MSVLYSSFYFYMNQIIREKNETGNGLLCPVPSYMFLNDDSINL